MPVGFGWGLLVLPDIILTYWSEVKGILGIEAMFWAIVSRLEVDKPDELLESQVETWEGVALEKVRVSDWYPMRTEVPPCRNDSRDFLNMEITTSFLIGGVSDMISLGVK